MFIELEMMFHLHLKSNNDMTGGKIEDDIKVGSVSLC